MTRKSNDDLKEELNINHRRGHLAQDSEPVDDDAINEDLHNVIVSYWKNRQKPGFVGYKDNLEYEEEEVRMENDVDISFLKNPRRTKPIHHKPDLFTDGNGIPAKSAETLENPGIKEVNVQTEKVGVEKKADAPTNKQTVAKEAGTLPQFQLSAEKLTEAKESGQESEALVENTTTADSPNRSPQHTTQANAIINHNPPNTSTTKKKKRKKKKRPGRFFKWFFTILLLLVVGGTVALGVMRYVGWKNSNATNDSGEDISTPNGVTSEDGGKTVIYKGVTYVYNEELSTILFIGVDREEYAEEGQEVSGEAGQADTVILTVVNQKTGEIRMIPLSRSTMVAIDQYNTDGSYWKQDILQLAVSFAYGSNIDENCKNVAKAVSRILYGMPVHRYVTMDLSAIPQLNDAVGGVTVNCLEDLTDVDETWTEGAEITLHGKQAETYVRHRKTTITDETQDNNAPRMERQKQYINSFMHTLLNGMKGDIFIPLRLYRDVGDDIYSDVTTAEIVYYTSMVVSKGFNNTMLSIKGSVKHNKFTEFYPDEEKLYELILDTFYERQ